MIAANTNPAIPATRDKMDPGFGKRERPDGIASAGPLPHDAVRSIVDTQNRSAKKAAVNSGPVPAVPAAAIRDSRIGGTISLLCAAAISAQTLFGLGRVIGLSPWTAWLLPAALDVYAMTATRVAFQVPTGHRARSKAIWNARIALLFTTGSNCLYHAMHLAANHTKWTAADWALIAVSALPPIVVERLLHLQSIVNSDSNAASETDAAPASPVASTVPSTAPAIAAPLAAPASATPQAQPAASKPIARSTAKPAADNSSKGTVSTLIPKDEQLRIVRGIVAEHGPDVPLIVIEERLRCHKSTASRLRSAVNEEAGTLPPAQDEGIEGVS